jgi:lipid II isoglutaminyl synthase (glutamine-hydrolysing)
MPEKYSVILGKAVKKIAQIRGGGSALPGLFVEKIDPDFVGRTLAQLPRGVVIVSGTNGKTTTTKMVVELLEGQGLKVFTNRTGSNFVRGVAAALLGDVDKNGILNADIAVLELDEAHAVHFVRTVKPRFSLLLNVMRDQLDRFGEIDTTAKMLAEIANNTSEGVVLNREDTRVSKIAKIMKEKRIAYFGLSEETRSSFPSDDEMRSETKVNIAMLPTADVQLESIDDTAATFSMGNRKFTTSLKLRGVYNIYNATAALALVRMVLGEKIDLDKLVSSLSSVTPAFGRGETIVVDGQPCELVLVKNPSGFRLALSSFSPDDYATMIAVNDNYADGRDMSWLWDVDFDSLAKLGVAQVSGVRAYDMALRLQYDEVEITQVDTSLPEALRNFISQNPSKPKRIYCTYTAMLALRRELAKITHVTEAIS